MIFKNNDEVLKKNGKFDAGDKFWDIGLITPQKKAKSVSHSTFDTDGVELTDKKNYDKAVSYKIDPPPKEHKSELLLSYSPEDMLIRRVDVYLWHSRYTFYEHFRQDAERYFDCNHGETEHIKFFSYMPVYMQMSQAQKNWYFWWRQNVRNKIYLETDSSYICLYIYEIINLPEKIPPEKGLELLCDIWLAYRNSYTKLDKLMTEWITDYCLINQLSFPFDRIPKNALSSAISLSAFKQFYVKANDNYAIGELVMNSVSTYKWQSSKYLTEENRHMFETHIVGAFTYALSCLSKEDERFDISKRGSIKKISRDAYSGSLCAYNIKRRLDIEYIDIGIGKGAGTVVTDMVKFCENKLRAYLGIKSRMSIVNLSDREKAYITEYFDRYLSKKHTKKINEIADYEAKYDIDDNALSLDMAKAIERASWKTTDKLMEGLLEDELPEEAKETAEPVPDYENETLEIAEKALLCILKSDMQALNALAEESYMMPETLIECVNELCYERLGDIAVEEKDGGYAVLCDYEQEIKEWLKV